jgi:hypothetical protein
LTSEHRVLLAVLRQASHGADDTHASHLARALGTFLYRHWHWRDLATAVPDAEGTLGGLVSLAEADCLRRLVRRALHDARRCSSDPLCAERLPQRGYAVTALGPCGLRRLADSIAAGKPPHDLTESAFETAHRVLDAVADGALSRPEAAAYLHGVAAGYDHRPGPSTAEQTARRCTPKSPPPTRRPSSSPAPTSPPPESATTSNVGVLIRGGEAPRRAAEHLHALRRDGYLTPL